MCGLKLYIFDVSTHHLTEDEIKAAFVSAANKALADKDTVIETFRLIRDTVFDTSALELEREELTDELNVVAGLIQDGIRQNAHVKQNQADYNREYETLTARYEKSKSRLDKASLKSTTRIPAAGPSNTTSRFRKNAGTLSRNTTLYFGTAWWSSRPSAARTTSASP